MKAPKSVASLATSIAIPQNGDARPATAADDDQRLAVGHARDEPLRKTARDVVGSHR